MDLDGRLVLAIKERGTVERLNANGTLTLIAGRPGERKLVDGPDSKARLNAPNAIAIVRTVRFTYPIRVLDGGTDFDGTGPRGSFGYLYGLVRSPTGRLYVTEPYTPSVRRIITDDVAF